MYYSGFNAEKQIKPQYLGLRTHFTTCAPHARCKQIHKCATCHKQWQKAQLKKHLSHITDKKLKKFKHALYVTITPLTCTHDYEIPNANIDHYLAHLTNSGAKRSASHPFHNGEYITFKEITRSSATGALLPHLHVILLTDTIPAFNNPLFDFHIAPIVNDLSPSFKNDYKNPLTQTLKKIFMYSTKSDNARIHLERSTSLSLGKSDIRLSSLFKTSLKKSHTLTPIHILLKNINKNALIAKREALKSHSDYKRNHPKAKGITIHRHALKVQKQLIAIEENKQALKTRLKAKLKRAKPRPNVPPTRTHTKIQT